MCLVKFLFHLCLKLHKGLGGKMESGVREYWSNLLYSPPQVTTTNKQSEKIQRRCKLANCDGALLCVILSISNAVILCCNLQALCGSFPGFCEHLPSNYDHPGTEQGQFKCCVL